MHTKFSLERQIWPVKQYCIQKLNANQGIYLSYFRIADVDEHKTKLKYALRPRIS